VQFVLRFSGSDIAGITENLRARIGTSMMPYGEPNNLANAIRILNLYIEKHNP
jgi:hypothetical protein